MSRRHRRRTARGASSVEYALIAVLIAVAIIGVVTIFAGRTGGLFQSSCDSFAQHTEGSTC
jgi:Flp pilus assembly pilin Flp